MSLIKSKQLLMINLMEIYLKYKKYKQRRQRIWTEEIYTKEERYMHGFFQQAYQIIKKGNDGELRKITRMNISTFQLLGKLLEKRLTKTSARQPIEPECRLVLTLMYLAQGAKWQTLAWNFRLGVTTVRNIILDTCDAIWSELQCVYLAPPNENEWEVIASAFYAKTGLPHCVGCIDGKHIRIRCPPRSGSQYYNYKKYHSIVLLAACDHNYCFTAVDIGAYGSQSDGGILRASSFGDRILKNTINLPPNSKVEGSDLELPFFFAGDAAFPLRTNIMRPYPGRYLPEDKARFNEIPSKARCRIENTFGIMTMQWRVLCDTILCIPTNAEKIVKAVVVLHNFVKLNDSEYCPTADEIASSEWRTQTSFLPQSRLFKRFNAPREAFKMRDSIKNFLNTT